MTSHELAGSQACAATALRALAPPAEASVRWAGSMSAGPSAALQCVLLERMRAGRCPVAWVAGTSDVGLRAERVEALAHDAMAALEVTLLAGRLVRELSSGERQRVSLAQALAPGTQEIALDEPTRHLDPRYVEALAALLERRRAQGARLLACDLRGQLPARLFDVEIGTQPADAEGPAPARPAERDAVSLTVPSPCLLGKPARRTAPTRTLGLRRGDLVALTGPNGSGKTSLLEALRAAAARSRIGAGLSRQDLEVHIFDHCPRRELEEVLDAWLPLASWLEQVIGQRSAGRTAKRLAPTVAAQLGLEPWLDCSVATLPLGALALLGVAVALIVGRDLVLLDEPTQGLDLASSRRLASLLVRCAEAGARVVVATHDPELLRVANRHWQVAAGTLQTGLTSGGLPT